MSLSMRCLKSKMVSYIVNDGIISPVSRVAIKQRVNKAEKNI